MEQRKVPQNVERTGLQSSFREARALELIPPVWSAEAARNAWGGGRYTAARSPMWEQGRSKTGIASLPHVKLAPMSASGPTGERQTHLDAIISSAGAGQRRRLFRGLDVLTKKVSERRLARRVPISPQHAAHVLEE